MALRLRRGLKSELDNLAVVAQGELIFTTDEGKLYVGTGGDGTTVIDVTGSVGGGGSTTLDALTDTDLTGAANNDVLTFNAGTNKWEAVAVPGVGILSLNDLSDVFLPNSPNNGDILRYDGINFTAGSVTDIFQEQQNYKINIVGDDSTILVDTDTNTFTGSFVGDGSGLTNIPGVGIPVIELDDLNDVFLPFPPKNGDILRYDGINFTASPVTDIFQEQQNYKINIVGDDSTIIIDTDTNNVTGNFFGDLIGDVTGVVLGNVVGNVTGDVIGTLNGTVLGNVIGDHIGSVFTDDSTVVIDGITGDVSANTLTIGNGGIIIEKDGNSLEISSALNNGRMDIATINTNVFNVVGDLLATPDGPGLTTSTSRGTAAAPAGLQVGDFSGSVLFSAYKTSLSDYRVNAGILSSIDTVTGTDDIPGKIAVALRDPDGDIFFALSVNSRGVTEAPIFKPTAYADTTARDAAITSPEAGMVIFVTDSDGGGTEALQVYKATGGWTTIS